jgi:hypothetical protein
VAGARAQQAQAQGARRGLTSPERGPRALRRAYGVQQLVCLGGFQNQRQEFSWGGHTLELDETKYEWGTLYEIECETVGDALRCAGWRWRWWWQVKSEGPAGGGSAGGHAPYGQIGQIIISRDCPCERRCPQALAHTSPRPCPP